MEPFSAMESSRHYPSSWPLLATRVSFNKQRSSDTTFHLKLDFFPWQALLDHLFMVSHCCWTTNSVSKNFYSLSWRFPHVGLGWAGRGGVWLKLTPWCVLDLGCHTGLILLLLLDCLGHLLKQQRHDRMSLTLQAFFYNLFSLLIETQLYIWKKFRKFIHNVHYWLISYMNDLFEVSEELYDV